MIEFILNDWKNFVRGLSFFGGILIVLYLVLRLAIQHGFNRKLEKLKGDINGELEHL